MQTHTSVDQECTAAALAAQAEDCAQLSRWYAARGDARRATLAVWAADLRGVQSLLWEQAVLAGTEPTQELRTAGERVGSALSSRALHSAATPRALLGGARQELLAALGQTLGDLMSDRFVALDHLDGLPAPTPGAANEAVSERLGGRSGEQLVGDLLVAAQDCRVVGSVMSQVGDDDEAQRQAASADLAGFEAYLVMVSAASGDATLATADLRWDLAATKASRDGSEADPRHLVTVQRAAMRAVVVPAEEPSLLAVLDLAPPQ